MRGEEGGEEQKSFNGTLDGNILPCHPHGELTYGFRWPRLAGEKNQ
jgi:hypothetical protein